MRIQIQTLIKRTVTEALNKRGQSALLACSSASKVGRKKTFPYIRENVAYFFQGESSQVATTISIRFHVFFTHITYLAILFREPHYLFVSLISGSLSPESRLGSCRPVPVRCFRRYRFRLCHLPCLCRWRIRQHTCLQITRCLSSRPPGFTIYGGLGTKQEQGCRT